MRGVDLVGDVSSFSIATHRVTEASRDAASFFAAVLAGGGPTASASSRDGPAFGSFSSGSSLAGLRSKSRERPSSLVADHRPSRATGGMPSRRSPRSA